MFWLIKSVNNSILFVFQTILINYVLYYLIKCVVFFNIILVPMDLPLEQKCLMFGACFMVVSIMLKLNMLSFLKPMKIP